MDLQPILVRNEVIKAIRSFFERQNFQEVITPVFNTALPLEPNIYSFQTTWKTSSGSREFYLTTSPESQLKKMLAAGIGNCFSIGKCFRNLEGSGALHNPEFLMLEWYREDATYEQIMKDVQQLIREVKASVDEYLQRSSSQLSSDTHWPILSLVDLFKKHADIDIESSIDDQALKQIAQQKGYDVKDASWSQLFDQIFLNEVEPHLPKSPFFLTDFPARTSPLCTVKKDTPYLAERFELYMGGIEIANGNTENLDVKMITSAFKSELQQGKSSDQSVAPIDQSFLDAIAELQKNNTSYAGIGLGIDRLTMILAGIDNIQAFDSFGIQ